MNYNVDLYNTRYILINKRVMVVNRSTKVVINLFNMTRRSDQKSGIKPQIYPGYNLDKSGGKWINPRFTPDLSKFYPGFVYIPPQIYPYFPPDKSGV
jgi:hypothetical protein